MQMSISKNVLSKLIQAAGYLFKMLHKAASEWDEEEQTTFRNWSCDFMTTEMVVMANESSKDNHTIFWQWGQSIKGTPVGVCMMFTRGEQYSILAVMSINGYIATHIIIGSVNSYKFLILSSPKWYACIAMVNFVCCSPTHNYSSQG